MKKISEYIKKIAAKNIGTILAGVVIATLTLLSFIII